MKLFKQSVLRTIKLVIALSFIIAVSGVVGYLAATQLRTGRSNSTSAQQFTFEKLPDTSLQTFARRYDDEIVLVPLDPKHSPIKPFENNTQYRSGNGTSGFGSDTPQHSPDFEKVAFIDDQYNLWLMTADGEHRVQVTEGLKVRYISDWSPDSQKLLIYTTQDDLVARYTPDYQGDRQPALEPESIQQLERNFKASGFYLINIDKNTYEHLAFTDDAFFQTWINPNKLLFYVDTDVGMGQETLYVEFDVATYTADSKDFDLTLKDAFAPQFNFSDDGKKWAFNLKAGEDQQSIIFAEYPSIEGETVITGRFAESQLPKISPTGDALVYQRQFIVNEPDYTYLYKNGKTEQLGEGRPLFWIDNNHVVYMKYSRDSSPSYVVYKQNIENKEVVTLYER